jgi:hypothetical protein
MATKRLSDITPAGSPPALTDTVVGVQQSGPNDLRYTFSQVASTVNLFSLVMNPPSSQNAPGTPYQLAFDSQGNLYICYSTNTWAKYTNAAPFVAGRAHFVIQGSVLYYRTGQPPPVIVGNRSD